jgi:hypothetical protein
MECSTRTYSASFFIMYNVSVHKHIHILLTNYVNTYPRENTL